jgi:hypothetical protein
LRRLAALFSVAPDINQRKADIGDLLNRAAFIPFPRNRLESFADLKNQMPSETETSSATAAMMSRRLIAIPDGAILPLIASGEARSSSERSDKFPNTRSG